MSVRSLVVCPPCDEEPGVFTSDREVCVLTDRAGGWGRALDDIDPRHLRRFACARVLPSADHLRDAAVAPLVDALLSRRLQTEEACIFNFGPEGEAELAALCVRHLVRGLSASPRELMASVIATHPAGLPGTLFHIV